MARIEAKPEIPREQIALTEIEGAFKRAKLKQGINFYQTKEDGFLQFEELDKKRGTKEATWNWEAMYKRLAGEMFGDSTAEELVAQNPQVIQKINELREKFPQITLPKSESYKTKTTRLDEIDSDEILQFLEGWKLSKKRIWEGGYSLEYYQVSDENLVSILIHPRDKKIRYLRHEKDKVLIEMSLKNVESLSHNYAGKNLTFETKKGETFVIGWDGGFTNYKLEDEKYPKLRITAPPDQAFRSCLDPYR